MDKRHADIETQIWHLNLSYLLLAQRILNHCESSALFRLDMDNDTGEKIRQLSLPELVRLSERPELITVFRLRGGRQIDILLSQSVCTE